MTRMEPAVWPLACGGACVFAIAVVLDGAPRLTILVILAVAVATWSLRAPLIASVLLGGMAWLFMTGFDLNADGVLRFTGTNDVLRLAVFIAAGLAGVAAGRLLGDPPAHRVVEGMPRPPEQHLPPEEQATPEEHAGPGVYQPTKITDGRRYCRPTTVPHAAARIVPRGRRRSGTSN
jgi:hypothetical protein